nr:hypothetical protein [uncultured Kingella sp.]
MDAFRLPWDIEGHRGTRGQRVPTLPNPFSGSLKAADKTPSLRNRIARICCHAFGCRERVGWALVAHALRSKAA